LQDRPELLTGAGADAPTRSVLRLIDTLCDAGESMIVRPPCPRCGRIIHLHRRIDGKWLCRNCTAKSRAQPCGRCGAVREAATRDQQGQPLCAHCLITDAANHETCVECGRLRPVQVRTPDGPLCGKCVPRPVLTCAVCGRTAPGVISKATGKPWCLACKQRWIRCARCGAVAPLRGGTVHEPLCSLCTRPDDQAWRSCPGCGQPGRIHRGRCARCTVTARLHDLLADDTDTIPADREVLYRALAATERPATLGAWLDRSSAPQMLRELAGRAITHQTLDELPDGKTVEHLRSILIAAGILPARDEHMVRLEHWVDATIAERADPDEQHLLRRYALWHMLRRLRQRTRGADTTHNQYVLVRQHLRAAIGFFDWLAAQGLSLADARQGDLDEWIASDNATLRRETRHFLRWAKKQKLTTLDAPAVRWAGPSGVIDTEARWDQARRLLHDETIKPEDRLAGLLVLLYAQWPATISRLTIEHIRTSAGQVLIRLGDEPVVLPEPVAALALAVVANRHGKAAVGDPGTSPWLFPGGQPGRPISPYALTERLRQLGLQPRQRPLHRAVPTRHRPARRRPRPHARHPHHRRRGLATRLRRRLDRLRRRNQPQNIPLKRGIPTVAISDVARGLSIPTRPSSHTWRSSPDGAPCGPPRNTACPPTPNGRNSSATSSAARSPPESAGARSAHHVSTSPEFCRVAGDRVARG
jgi:hypothetical protein